MAIEIKKYDDSNYSALVALYKSSNEFDFDEVTDSKESISKKIEKDPESVLLAYDEEKLVGSVSIIEDGRIALLFRLVTKMDSGDVAQKLISHAEEILSRRGYKEVHITGPSGNQVATALREGSGFKKGKRYDWFWKNL